MTAAARTSAPAATSCRDGRRLRTENQARLPIRTPPGSANAVACVNALPHPHRQFCRLCRRGLGERSLAFHAPAACTPRWANPDRVDFGRIPNGVAFHGAGRSYGHVGLDRRSRSLLAGGELDTLSRSHPVGPSWMKSSDIHPITGLLVVPSSVTNTSSQSSARSIALFAWNILLRTSLDEVAQRAEIADRLIRLTNSAKSHAPLAASRPTDL